jgi:antirestriction protein ArdC
MSEIICHDFKTPRSDTSKRLPDSFKAIPILFYLSLIGATYFMTMDWLAYKQAQKDKIEAEARKAHYDSETQRFQDEKTKLDAETEKAEKLAKWIEGARNVQPITAAIARAMPPEVRLSDLTIERSEQVPENLALSIRINGGSASEIGLMETGISRLQYRSVSPQQSKDGEAIEYRSTLVRQDP